MKANQLFNAVPALQKIMELKLPIKKAHAIYFLAKQINEQREFFIKEEKKLIEKFNGEVNEQGLITFTSESEKINFLEEHNKLNEYELLEVNPIELNFDDLKDAELTPAEIMQLENIINFLDNN